MFMTLMLVCILVFVANSKLKEEYNTINVKAAKPDCPPHKWYYADDGWMKCSQCKIDTRTSLSDETN